MSERTPADISALTNNSRDGYCYGNGGMWIFALLILLRIGNGGWFGGNRPQPNGATQSDVVYTSAFNQLQDENTAIRSDIQRTAYENRGVTKDRAYNNLSELRNIQAGISAGFAQQQKCCCETLRAIDSVNYNGALNTASVQKTIIEEAQKTRDRMNGNRMAERQAEIQSLKLQQARCGVVRYPTATTYTGGYPPFCHGNTGTTTDRKSVV